MIAERGKSCIFIHGDIYLTQLWFNYIVCSLKSFENEASIIRTWKPRILPQSSHKQFHANNKFHSVDYSVDCTISSRSIFSIWLKTYNYYSVAHRIFFLPLFIKLNIVGYEIKLTSKSNRNMRMWNHRSNSNTIEQYFRYSIFFGYVGVGVEKIEKKTAQ